MQKLLAHFVKMQEMTVGYLMPDTYTDRDGKTWPAPSNELSSEAKQAMWAAQTQAYAADIIYMLDGPEQREAQAEAEGGKIIWEKRTRIGACETITRVYDQDAPASTVVSGPFPAASEVLAERIGDDAADFLDGRKGVILAEGETFDAEEVRAAADLALSRAKPDAARVHTQLVDFPGVEKDHG